MVSSDGKPTVTINAMPDELNQFFARFEKPWKSSEANRPSNQDTSDFTVDEYEDNFSKDL